MFNLLAAMIVFYIGCQAVLFCISFIAIVIEVIRDALK